MHACGTVTSLALWRCGGTDGSHDWSAGMEGCRFFREDRQGRYRGGIALYVSKQLECMELCLGMDEKLTESLWVWI